VHLYRQCALRIMAVVQILREEGWPIKMDEVSSLLNVGAVMQREMSLHSPNATDVPLLEVFNKEWLRSRETLANGRGPDVLFNTRVVEADNLSNLVSAVLDPANSAGASDAGDGGAGPSSPKAPPVTSSANAADFVDVHRRPEEELDFEAEEDEDGSHPPSVIEVDTEAEIGSSSEESSSSESDESDTEDDKQPAKSPSYAAAVSSPALRKVALKSPMASGRTPSTGSPPMRG
jgi:hypothetical protein